MKNKKLDEVLEGFKPIPMKRLFYPRGMKLSEEFVNAFHREFDRLVSDGLNPKSLVERFGKAMKFHVNEPRKYKLLDEDQVNEGGPFNLGSKENFVEVHTDDGLQLMTPEEHARYLKKKKPTKKDHPKSSKLHKKKHN